MTYTFKKLSKVDLVTGKDTDNVIVEQDGDIKRIAKSEFGDSSGSSLPEGGEVGQILSKTEDGSEWIDIPGISDAPDLSDYALKSEIPDLTNYALKSDIPESPDLTNYALKSDIPTVPTNVSAFINDAGYLTAKDVTTGGGTVETLDAEKVYFSTDLTTTVAIGNVELENGQATIEANGKNLKQVWDAIFVKEQNPTTINPSVSLTFSQAKAYEVGTKITPTYSASLKPGSYTYGPDTGVTATAWEVTDTAGNSATTATGSFAELQVVDDISYKITAKATHGAGAIPLTNVGNEYADGQIAAGSKSATSGAVTGYRNTFYGTVTTKDEVTSDIIRKLTSSNKALIVGNSFTVTVPVGALRVIVAYPATLRDVNSIKDVNGMNAEISSGFSKQTIRVEGANAYSAIDYKVYTMDFATANDTANKFTVTI